MNDLSWVRRAVLQATGRSYSAFSIGLLGFWRLRLVNCAGMTGRLPWGGRSRTISCTRP